MSAKLPPIDKTGRRHYALRLVIVAIVALLFGLGIAARLAWLQVAEGSHYSALARGNRIRVVPIAPTRGLIFDRNGKVLAENIPMYELTLTPDQVPEIGTTIKRLDKLIGLSADDIQDFHHLRETKKSFQPVPIKTDLTPQEVARFAVHRQHFPGVALHATLKRHYPAGAIGAAVAGYVGLISEEDLKNLDPDEYRASAHVGKTGVEFEYEKLLHGEVGFAKVEVNAQGRRIRILETHPPKGGKNIHLTIDTRLQEIAYRALGSHAGAVVAIQPQTGAVLCLVSKPGYDPNEFVNGISQAAYSRILSNPDDPLINRAIAGRYAPGSTIKPFIGMAALEYGVLTPATTIYAGPTFRLPNYSHVFHDWNPYQNSYETLATAITGSVDTFFYQVAQELGIRKMHDFLYQFGFGREPPIDLPGARAGVNPSPKWKMRVLGKPWYRGETINNGIGQGYMLVTPLQLAMATAAISMHGELMRPHVLEKAVNPATGTVMKAKPRQLNQVTLPDPGYWNYIIHAMHEVIASPDGTAHGIAGKLDYPAAGKTGSAQVVSEYHGEELELSEIPYEERVNGLFIAFAPIEHPQIAVAVIVQHGGVGAHSAAPIARAIISTWLDQHPPGTRQPQRTTPDVSQSR
ncbi:MAG: penicillin-binding protein 2 [Gammaproteobacteria bacterium]|nr:penicillin-binding protein 2 [Gammaproteobacteria bacterium]